MPSVVFHLRRLRYESLEKRRLLTAYCVNSLADAPIDLSDSETTLREAIFCASQSSGVDTIKFAAALFDSEDTVEIRLSEGELVVDSDVAISVPRDAALTLRASDGARVLRVTDGAAVSLTNVTLVGSAASGGYGGTLLVSSGALTLSNVVVESGSANYGGGLAVSSGSVSVSECVFRNCSAVYGGGAIWLGAGSQLVGTDLVVERCSAGWYGGALYLQNAEAAFFSSTISDNTAGYDGGGIANYNGSLTLRDSQLTSNLAVRGGAVVNYGSCSVYGSALTSNRAYAEVNLPGRAPIGGALLNYGALYIGESTIAGNSALGVGASGGGLYLASGSARLVNSIAAVNASVKDSDLARVSNAALSVERLLTIWSGEDEPTGAYAYDPTKPLFADSEKEDWRLAFDSQAIDLGLNELALEDGYDAESLDLRLASRLQGAAIDLGAYEYSSVFDIKTAFEFDAYSVQEGCSVYLAVRDPLPDASSCLWDFGGGSVLEAPPAAWFDVSKLGLVGGNAYDVRLLLRDPQGNLTEAAAAELTVASVAPSILVESEILADGMLLRLDCQYYAPSGAVAENWTIDWGDGRISSYDALADSLTASHFYACALSELLPVISIQTTDVYGRTFRAPYGAYNLELESPQITTGGGATAFDDESYGKTTLDAAFAEFAFEPILPEPNEDSPVGVSFQALRRK